MAASGETTQAHEELYGGLPYAGLQIRAVAFILDCLAMFGFFMVFFTIGGLQVLARGDDPPDSAVYIWIGILLVAFPIFALLLFTALWWLRGQSIGMMAVHIVVTDRDGGSLSLGRSFLRALLVPISILPLGLGLLPLLFDSESRALHDQLAGTVVLEIP